MASCRLIPVGGAQGINQGCKIFSNQIAPREREFLINGKIPVVSTAKLPLPQ